MNLKVLTHQQTTGKLTPDVHYADSNVMISFVMSVLTEMFSPLSLKCSVLSHRLYSQFACTVHEFSLVSADQNNCNLIHMYVYIQYRLH